MTHHLGHRGLEVAGVCRRIVAFALLLGAQVLPDHLRADQAADVGGENSVGAAVHAGRSLCVSWPWRTAKSLSGHRSLANARLRSRGPPNGTPIRLAVGRRLPRKPISPGG